MSAAGALVEMATECGGATPRNGQQHFDVLPGDPVTISFDESVSRSTTSSLTWDTGPPAARLAGEMGATRCQGDMQPPGKSANFNQYADVFSGSTGMHRTGRS